eukprot:TRINITY_DN6065_c0_g1_i3.p1 TRINITY_DN6065_c0_g1~~TRINITY_DN6065_c0_g1_i3.p1  ORF type:complete len:589 (-),score=139.40 TRINITY_DN6065_c0_g1_i3:34-1635(-)
MTEEGQDFEGKVTRIKTSKYQRTAKINTTKMPLRKEQRKMEHKKKLIANAIEAAARSELLLPESTGYMESEGPLDKTFKVSQKEIKEAVDLQSRDKIFDLRLPEFGPYSAEYTKDGQFVLLAGEKGHISLFDWHKNVLKTEFHLKETVRDVCFLHNETMFAVAQKKQVFVYDYKGTEIHSLKTHADPYALQFLPYHFLLCSIGKQGILRYQDISTGALLQGLHTKLGPCSIMKQNPYNAILHLGHQNGTVSLWSPNSSQPHVKMLCHKAALTDLAIDRSGHIMVTTGLDAKVKVFDIRTYKKLFSYDTPSQRTVQTLDISHKGALGLGFGSHVQVWKDFSARRIKEPYLIHRLPFQNKINRVRFCPFEDVMGIGHANGFSSVIVPGAGEANFDTFEANPYQTTKQRRETTVVRLLEKIPSDMITLDPMAIGTVARDNSEKVLENQRLIYESQNPGAKWSKVKKEKKKMRGKNKIGKKVTQKERKYVENKQKNAQAEEEKASKQAKGKQAKEVSEGPATQEEVVQSALERFNKK